MTHIKVGAGTGEQEQPSRQACVITGERRNSGGRIVRRGGESRALGLCVLWALEEVHPDPVTPGNVPHSSAHTEGFSLVQWKEQGIGSHLDLARSVLVAPVSHVALHI